VLGGAPGGLIGNQIGRGAGNTAATIGGAVVGAILGGSVGRSMDDADHLCMGQALEYGRTRQPVSWRSPRGNAYEVMTADSFLGNDGEPCRDFVTTAVIDGRRQRVSGTACRGPDGLWRAVD